MVNAERLDKCKKEESDKVIGDKCLPKIAIKKHIDQSRILNSRNRRTELKFLQKNEEKIAQNEAEIVTQKENSSIQENTAEMSSHSVDKDLSEWKQVRPKGRRKKKNSNMPEDIKTNGNYEQKQRQERLKPSERQMLHCNEENYLQLINSTLSPKAVPFFPSKTIYSNRIAVPNKNSEDSPKVNEIVPDALNKCDETLVGRNEKLNAGAIKLNSKSGREAKQGEFGETILFTEASDKNLHANSSNQLKHTGAIPKRSRYIQTSVQFEYKTSASQKQDHKNMHDETKESLYKRHQRLFPNAHDRTQSNPEVAVNELDSENVTDSQNNFNEFVVPNLNVKCIQYDPFIWEVSYKGEAYYGQVVFLQCYINVSSVL